MTNSINIHILSKCKYVCSTFFSQNLGCYWLDTVISLPEILGCVRANHLSSDRDKGLIF